MGLAWEQLGTIFAPSGRVTHSPKCERAFMMKYTVVLEVAEEGGYTVSAPALSGCISEGDTREEALENIRDAIALYLRGISRELEMLKQQREFTLAEVTL